MRCSSLSPTMVFSYLCPRQQRTRVKRKTSSWWYPNGSIATGLPFGASVISGRYRYLAPGCQTHKYVDDTTVSEILNSASSPSYMSDFLHKANLWALKNDMKINTNKTKELVIGPLGQQNHTPLETEQGIIERVHEFKLLGIYLDSFLLGQHILTISQKRQPHSYISWKFLNELDFLLITYYITTLLSRVQYLNIAAVYGIITSQINWHYRLKTFKNERLKLFLKLLEVCRIPVIYTLIISLLSNSAVTIKLATFSLRFLYLTHVCIPCSLHRVIKLLYSDFELLENFQPWPLEQNVTNPS